MARISLEIVVWKGFQVDAVVTKRRDPHAALKVLKRLMKQHGQPREDVALIWRCTEEAGHRKAAKYG
ncbi:MAG: hypothetical protein ABIR53_05180, partial [Paraperlucidibaca sp.]